MLRFLFLSGLAGAAAAAVILLLFHSFTSLVDERCVRNEIREATGEEMLKEPKEKLTELKQFCKKVDLII